MRRVHSLVAVAAVLTAVLGAHAVSGTSAAPVLPPVPAFSVARDPAMPPVTAAEPARTNDTEDPGVPPPELVSLQGTRLPDGLRTDAQGNLVRDRELQLYFDVLLSAQGDAGSPDRLDAIVQQLLARRLRDAALRQARELWMHYVQYRDALHTLAGTQKPDTAGDGLRPAEVDALADILVQRSALQQRLLPEVAVAWFADDNTYDSEQLARLRAAANGRPLPATDAGTAARSVHVPTPEELQAGMVTGERQREYETRRDQYLATKGLDEEDRWRQIEALRAEYFMPGSGEYATQTVRDTQQRFRR